MAEEINGNTSPSRLDRIERIVEVLANVTSDLQQETKILLSHQVVMQDVVTKLGEAQKRTEESLRHTDERMNALIITVDEIVRRQPPPTK